MKKKGKGKLTANPKSLGGKGNTLDPRSKTAAPAKSKFGTVSGR